MIGWLLRRAVRLTFLVLFLPLSLLRAALLPFARRDLLVVRLRGEVHDLPRAQPLWRMLARAREATLSLLEVLEVCDEAAADPRLGAVLLRLERTGLSLVQGEALLAAIDRLKAAGKKVVVWADPLTGPALVVAAAADRAYGVPEGQVEFTGVRVRAVFLHDLLELLGVVPQIQRHGDYKTMADMFIARGMSDAHREMAKDLSTDLYEQVITPLIVGRRLPREQVIAALDDAPLDCGAAVERGLLDGAVYRDQLAARAAALLEGEEQGDGAEKGTTVAAAQEGEGEGEHDHDHERERDGEDEDEDAGLRTCGPQLYLAARRRRRKRAAVLRDLPTVRVIHLAGAIAAGESGRGVLAEPTVEALDAARRERTVKAVVLRIDSPGGSATASDTIWRAARRLDQKKPLVASMGTVAASGGYYVAVASREIWAHAGTLTGSIGIVSGKFHLAPALHRWGVRVEAEACGARAGMYDPDQPADPDELAALHREMMRFYRTFLERVAQGRRMSVEAVDAVAQGRVWTGRRAQGLGLVDRLGDLQTAIARAAELAEVRRPFRTEAVTPGPRTLARLIGSDAAAPGLATATAGSLAALDDALRLSRESALAYAPWCVELR